MKKYIISFALFVVISFIGGFSLAADIDGYVIDVQKNLEVNNPVDLTIRAVKDGKIVKDYEDTIFIKIEGLSSSQAIIPSNGVYIFSPEDQGEKLFSKGLKIMKAGNYNLLVESVMDSTIKSKTTLVVKNSEEDVIKDIDIISPADNGTEIGGKMDVVGTSIGLPNSKINIYLNSELVGESTTDANGDFSAQVLLTKTGNNILEIKSFNIDQKLIGKSNLIHFLVQQRESSSAIKEVIVNPDTDVEKSTKVTITLKTKEDIGIAKILLGESSYQMDKVNAGEFQKSFLAQKPGKINIKFSVVEDGTEKVYDRDTVITVKGVNTETDLSNHNSSTGDIAGLDDLPQNSIGEININPANIDGSSININWSSTGDAEKFMIAYGIEKTTLQETVIVNSKEVKIEKLSPNTTYYFQITPLNQSADKNGTPSPIIEYSFGKGDTCVVGNIAIKTVEKNGKNYLSWSPVKNGEKYEIYRSSTANNKTTISDMNKIGETTNTEFEYPFDINSKEDKYAYYAIQAVCKGGQKIQVGNIEKVKTGPLDNLLVIVIFSGLLFSMYKLYKVTN